MKEYLHNTFCPRYKVSYEIKRCTESKKYMIFSPEHLKKLLGLPDNAKTDTLYEKVKEYLDSHPELETSVKRPKGYMLGLSFTDISPASYSTDVLCDDLELFILVISSTVGNLYIPSRKPQITKTNLERDLLFPLNEVYNDD